MKMKKKFNKIVLALYIINFCILLVVFIKIIVDKEPSTEYLFGSYFWEINLIEIILIIANLNKINKRKLFIAMLIVFIIQMVVIFYVPAYCKYDYKLETDKNGLMITNPAVMPSKINAYGLSIKD